MLETDDPASRWRDVLPKSKKRIESAVVLPDGTPVRHAVELKRWLVANIDIFSVNFGEKLLPYATIQTFRTTYAARPAPPRYLRQLSLRLPFPR